MSSRWWICNKQEVSIEAKVLLAWALPFVIIPRQISRTWAGTPLPPHDVIIDGLHSTKTDTGLRVEATLFDTVYEKGLSVTDTEMNLLRFEKQCQENN